jgi:signal transduction histidine kinase
LAQEQHTPQLFCVSQANQSDNQHSVGRRRLPQSQSQNLTAASARFPLANSIDNAKLALSGANPLIWKSALVIITCGILLSACRSQQGNRKPFIEFTRVPLAEEGGTRKLEAIEGRVVGAQPGQQIILFARSGAWYIQPFADQPFTIIQADSKWKSSTHLGTEYAALLVEPDYRPPAEIEVLPGEGDGVVALAIVSGEVKLLVPLFWQTWWFGLAVGLSGLFALLVFYRLRMRQLTRQWNVRFEERFAERTRIAQELHDTLLQGVLSASMQLHVAVDHLPADSPSKPSLNRVLELMAQVIEEGRNAVRGLRSSDTSSQNLEQAFSRIQQELAIEEPISFRVIVEGRPKLLHPIIRDEVYRIGREALVNAFRHAQAKRIEAEMDYADRYLRLVIRDDGCGIDPQVLRSGREGHWGLSGMRERAEGIGARFKVRSRLARGTEVELHVPGQVAFANQSSAHPVKWFASWILRKPKAERLEQPESEGKQ